MTRNLPEIAWSSTMIPKEKDNNTRWDYKDNIKHDPIYCTNQEPLQKAHCETVTSHFHSILDLTSIEKAWEDKIKRSPNLRPSDGISRKSVQCTWPSVMTLRYWITESVKAFDNDSEASPDEILLIMSIKIGWAGAEAKASSESVKGPIKGWKIWPQDLFRWSALRVGDTNYWIEKR